MPPAMRRVAPSPAWLTQKRDYMSSHVRCSHFRVWRGRGGGQDAEQTGPTAAHELFCSDVRSRLFEQVHLRGLRVEGIKVTGCMHLGAALPALPFRFEEGLGHCNLALPYSG